MKTSQRKHGQINTRDNTLRATEDENQKQHLESKQQNDILKPNNFHTLEANEIKTTFESKDGQTQ